MNFRPVRFLLLSLGSLVVACSSDDGGDPAAAPASTVLGEGQRIRDVVNPAAKRAGANVYISAAQVIAVDIFDETKNGSSKGTVYVQDLSSAAPFSGTSLYQPAFIPADLRVAPGDAVDIRGQYTESGNVGTAVFTPPAVLPQLFRPVVTPRYEAPLVAPHAIDVNDLNNYAKGRQWLDMLVTVHDVTLVTAPTKESNSAGLTGRVTAQLIPGDRNAPTMSNELYDLPADSIPAGTKLKSLTGVVTWFFSYHIAPRSPADIVQ